MSLSTRLAERGIVVNTPTNVLAAEATRIAQEARTLQGHVTEAVDRIAATDARLAALHLEDLAGVLHEVGR